MASGVSAVEPYALEILATINIVLDELQMGYVCRAGMCLGSWTVATGSPKDGLHVGMTKA